MFERSEPHIRIRFGADHSAARAARRTALLLAPSPGVDQESTRLGLVITELVENVIDHTAQGGCLSVWASRDRTSVRIEVADSSSEFPVLPRSTLDSDHVSGLQVVNHYCSRWGVVQAHDGKVVWAELTELSEPLTMRFDGSSLVTPGRPIDRDVSGEGADSSRAQLNGCLIADIGDMLAELVMIGDFDLPELADLLPTFAALAHEPCPIVTIDLSGVAYIGAAGIRLIVGLAEEVRHRGSKFFVIGASRLVDAVIDATDCRRVLGNDWRRHGFKPR